MVAKAAFSQTQNLKECIEVARGLKKASLVLKGGSFLDVFSGRFVKGDIAIHQGLIVGTCESYEGVEEKNIEGCYVVPGFIDAHVHIESSLVTPARFAQTVLPCGTTT